MAGRIWLKGQEPWSEDLWQRECTCGHWDRSLGARWV